jgi:hypothetical protein
MMLWPTEGLALSLTVKFYSVEARYSPDPSYDALAQWDASLVPILLGVEYMAPIQVGPFEPYLAARGGVSVGSMKFKTNYAFTSGPAVPFQFGVSEESSPPLVIEVEGGLVYLVSDNISASMGVTYQRTGRLFKFSGFGWGTELHSNGLVARGVAIVGSVQIGL